MYLDEAAVELIQFWREQCRGETSRVFSLVLGVVARKYNLPEEEVYRRAKEIESSVGRRKKLWLVEEKNE